jgi:hypothetical protein
MYERFSSAHAQRQAAQGVVASQLEHQDVGMVLLEQGGKPRTAADVVSPLMLALTTVAPEVFAASLFSSSGTQPVPRFRPYSALMESPSTKIVFPPAPWPARHNRQLTQPR